MIKFLYTFVLIIGVMSLHARTDVPKKEIIQAIKEGVPATKKLLTKVPIDYISVDDDTLLHYAVRLRKQKVVEYLVNQKILISRKGGLFYGTALEEAIYYGYLGIASYLIEKGSLLNIQDKNGNTALHIAARNGYLDIVEQLIAQGASKSIVNNEGLTPYDLVPDLSWDSRKELKKVLSVPKSKNFDTSNRVYINIGNSRIETKKNKTINVVDKKTKIDNSSNIGIDIDIKRTNRF